MKKPEASWRLGYQIALPGEAQRVSEMKIKPCSVEMADCVLDEQWKKKTCKSSVV
jgi:hypothetical protein